MPPQIPKPQSISSVSPQRRFNGFEVPSPFARPTQVNFTYNVPLDSPQGYSHERRPSATSPNGGHFQVPAVPAHGHRLRDRNSGTSVSTNRSSLGPFNRKLGTNILPTPDPTVASCISDEDVALQLMRLSDMSNYSHGRTSGSGLDDAFSGRADANSTVSNENSEDEDGAVLPATTPQTVFSSNSTPGLPKPKRKRTANTLPSYDSIEQTADEGDDDYDNTVFKSEVTDEEGGLPKAKIPKTKMTIKARTGSGKPNSLKTGAVSKPKAHSLPNVMDFGPGARKMSVASNVTSGTLTLQHQLGVDEDDLSSQPRCQRCRKSKKGCDRQRPCGRCKDAGIGIEGCISEDEGNGRKGRYGRHMGVSLMKANSTGDDFSVSGSIASGARSPSVPNRGVDADVAAAGVLEGMAGMQGDMILVGGANGAGKKRKR